jgi:hypothetical protein
LHYGFGALSGSLQTTPSLDMLLKSRDIEPNIHLWVEQVAVVHKLDVLKVWMPSSQGLSQAVYGLMQVAASRIGLGIAPKQVHQDILGYRSAAMCHEVLENALTLEAIPRCDQFVVLIHAERP